MRQRVQLAVAVSLMALSMLACQVCGLPSIVGSGRTVNGSGNVVEETREVNDVTGVELATIGTLHVEVGEGEELRIEAEDNLIQYFETDVRNGRLRIDTRNNVSLRTTRSVHYYLTVTALDTIVISSSGDVEVPDLEAESFSATISSSGDLQMEDLEADTFSVNLTSSGDVTMSALYADTLEVDISSSGNLDIADGSVEQQDITISSSGDYTAEDLESVEAEVRLTSSGSATIRVRDYLRADLSSSGDLRYVGNPTLDVTTTSSGDVFQIGE
jgi:hypothetical protein